MTLNAQRRHLLTCAASGLGASLAWPALAQSGPWPNRPLKWIVSQPAGAGPDILARYIADQLARSWGGSVVVENRPGGQT
jgi:tripartite-type tricarboxylate transporter receptor subunit TctC